MAYSPSFLSGKIRTLRICALVLSIYYLWIALTGTAQAQVYRRLHAFRALNQEGAQPMALVHAQDGFWYGVTRYGGAYDYGGQYYHGTFFRQDASGNVTILHHFTGLRDGREPQTLLQASDGFFYGIVQGGGGSGSIFRADRQGHLTLIHSFRQSSQGSTPTVLAEGSDGRLYGATKTGGASSRGTLFRMERDGANFMVLRSLDNNTGYEATTLLRGTDGNLYGTMYFNGGIFRLTPAGDYTLLRRFQRPGGYGTTALIEGSDGFLYGVNQSGWDDASPGTLFRADKAGNITQLHIFHQAEGTFPTGLVQGADNAFYITTVNDAAQNRGSLLRWSAGQTTLLRVFDRRHELNTTVRLFTDWNGAVYGATQTGGANCAGTLFRLDAAGSAETTHSFGFQTEGSGPTALIKASDGNLYGVTASGGEYNRGTVFRIDRSRRFTRLHSFDSHDGDIPSALAEGGDGYLYGLTSLGGAYERGTLFRISRQGDFTLLFSFGPPNGYGNPAQILCGADGQVVARLSYLDYPTLVRISPEGELTRFFTPSSSTTGSEVRSMTAAPDGSFYLATAIGPIGEVGQISRVEATGAFQPIYGFQYANQSSEGSLPRALTVGRNGVIAGATNIRLFQINAAGQFRALHPISGSNSTIALVSEGNAWFRLSDDALFQFTSTSSPALLHTFDVFRMDGNMPQALVHWQKNCVVGALRGGGQPPRYSSNGVNISGAAGGGLGLIFEQRLDVPGVTPVGESLRITRSALISSRDSYLFRGTLTLTNLSSQTIKVPVQITINLPNTYQFVINQEGTYNDLPFLTVRTSIRPGASVQVPIEIYNPLLMSTSFSATAYIGEF